MTLLEEHEISPTYEIYFTGCSLRCRFCTMAAAVAHPTEGEWLEPQALAAQIAAPSVPPFRAISLVGGDPSVHLPYVRALVPALRQRFPGVPLVFNTHLYFGPETADWVTRTFDHVVGDLHFWTPDCAARIGGARDYPAVARSSAEIIARGQTALILRVLALPGHIECCAEPSLRWASGLPRTHVHAMTHYTPADRARTDPVLGRQLTPAEIARVRAIDARRPATAPLPWTRPRNAEHRDPPAPLEIDRAGRVVAPLVTGALLPLLASLEPELSPRLYYLQGLCYLKGTRNSEVTHAC